MYIFTLSFHILFLRCIKKYLEQKIRLWFFDSEKWVWKVIGIG